MYRSINNSLFLIWVLGKFYKSVRRSSGIRCYVNKPQTSSGEDFQLKFKEERELRNPEGCRKSHRLRKKQANSTLWQINEVLYLRKCMIHLSMSIKCVWLLMSLSSTKSSRLKVDCILASILNNENINNSWRLGMPKVENKGFGRT